MRLQKAGSSVVTDIALERKKKTSTRGVRIWPPIQVGIKPNRA